MAEFARQKPQQKENATLEVRLFGTFDVRVQGIPCSEFPSRKARWLLTLLVLRLGHAIPRHHLAELLWPDSETPRALFNLRQTLGGLRRALGTAASCLRASGAQALLLEPANVWADVTAFDAAIAKGETAALEQAVGLYRGPLLAECLEPWMHPDREAREQAYLSALETLADRNLSEGAPSAAVPWVRRLISADPYRESAHRTLMQLLSDAGEGAAVTQVYRDLRLRLHRDFNTDPAPETNALYKRLIEHKTLPAGPALATPAPPGTARRLPIALSDLIGREQEVKEVCGWLGKSRLLTLTGAGGVGKTRLAIAVAERTAGSFTEGAWFVDLAPLTDPSLLAHITARTLGVQEERGVPIEEILEAALQSRLLLLVLDNCERLLDASAQLANRLLSVCPGLQIIVTSRQALGLPGERVYRVPSLSLPPKGAAEKMEPALLLEYGAVRLYVERAVQANPTFRLSRRNSQTVAETCRCLDGLPLAIEMAAARVRSLSPQEIQTRLQDRFRLLTGGNRAALPRQRTLRASIDWSYDLLADAEKALLRRLSVFAGGWTLDAAIHVCGVPKFISSGPQRAHPHDEWELLSALVEKSLVIAEETPEGRTRFRLLESVAEYGRERIRQAGEEALFRHRHLHYFVQWAEEMEHRAQGPANLELLAQIAQEHDNLCAALDFGLSADDSVWERRPPAKPFSDAKSPVSPSSETAFESVSDGILFPSLEFPLRLAAALFGLSATYAHSQRALKYLRAALALDKGQPLPSQARAKALQALAALTVELDHEEAEKLFQERLALWRLGDGQRLISALQHGSDAANA